MRTRSGAGGNSPDADDDYSEEITDDGSPPLQSDVSDMDPAFEEQVLETNVDVVIDSSAFQTAVKAERVDLLWSKEARRGRMVLWSYNGKRGGELTEV